MNKSRNTCKTCKHFEDSISDEQMGLCRRNAPRPSLREDGASSTDRATWPVVDEHEWCGEWTALTTPDRTLRAQ